MSWLKKVSITILAIIAIALVFGLFLPTRFHTKRSISVNAKVDKVFALVNDLTAWQKWSPWLEKDKATILKFSQPAKGGGAWYTWQSEKLGRGKLTIARSMSGRKIETLLSFQNEGNGKGYWLFKESSGATEVTWGFEGDAGNDIIKRYFGLRIDALLGPDLEKGLQNLKAIAENT